MKNILFLTHNTSRTGAPLVLLYFMQWLKQYKSNIKITVIALEEGGLSGEFIKVADSYYSLTNYERTNDNPIVNLGQKLINKFLKTNTKKNNLNKIMRFIGSDGFDIIYANTIVTVPLACELKDFFNKGKLVVHVHELKTIIEVTIQNLPLDALKIDGFIAASKMVASNLESNWLIPEQKIKTIYEFAPKSQILDQKKKAGDFIVGGSGTVHWRKGSDLFIQVARYLQRYHPDIKIKFIWIGGMDKVEKAVIEGDIAKAGLKDMVLFLGEKKLPTKNYNSFDVFILPSREDPFPLVCIEVGRLGKPIICFQSSTGITEVMGKGGGKAVPYLDTRAMAEEVMRYYKNPELIKADGEKNKEIFSDFVPEIQCPKIFTYLQEV